MTKRETYISRQAKRLSKGQIDRRRFVMSALATGVTMPTAMSLASRAEAMVPKRGGTLRFAIGGGGQSLRSTSDFARVVALASDSCLVSQAANGEVIGDLAEHFRSDDLGLTWVFDLRQGARFHSGKLVTSEDVRATFLHAAKHFPQAKGALTDVADIQTDGPSRVVFRLAHPHLRFPALLYNPSLIIRPSRDGVIDTEFAGRTGPYRLTDVHPDGNVTLIRNPDDWNSDRGFFDEVHLSAVPDTGLRQSAMMNGEVDVVDQVDPRAHALMASLPEVSIRKSPGFRHLLFSMSMAFPVLANPDVRCALKYAVDRQSLLDTAFLGLGRIGADVATPVADAPSYDPEKAVWHWKRSGVTGPISLAVGAEEPPAVRMAAEVFSASAQASEIDISVSSQSVNPGMIAQLKPGHSAEDAAYAASYLPGAACCVTGWAGTRDAVAFQAAIRAARAAEDDSAHMAEARHILATRGAECLPVWTSDLYAHSTRLALPKTDRIEAADIVLSGWFC